MFEGWLYPLLASYLGHYIKGLHKEQVSSSYTPRCGTCTPASLSHGARLHSPASCRSLEWSRAARERGAALGGACIDTERALQIESTQQMTTAAAHETQAFEYLQLPFAIVSATVGRLELQARPCALTSGSLVFVCTPVLTLPPRPCHRLPGKARSDNARAKAFA